MPAPQASAQAWASMVSEMQKGALSTRLGIPIIYGIDAVHGHNNVYKATIFPHNVGLGATGYWLHLLVICLQYINCEVFSRLYYNVDVCYLIPGNPILSRE